MNIAFIIPSLANRGPIIVVKDLCSGLIKKGHFCKVFYFDSILEVSFDCEVEKINFFSKFDFSQWDIVHSHMLRPDIWVFMHKPLCIAKSVKFITTLHNPISYKAFRTFFSMFTSLIGSFVWNIALKRFDYIVVLNSDTKLSLSKKYQRKASVIFNGRDISIANKYTELPYRRNIIELRNKYKIIGTLCGMYKRKGIEQVLVALLDLPNFAFIGVGDGPQLNEWKGLADKLGVSNRCLWIGYSTISTDYLAYFDIFILPSRSEGFPLAMIEASIYGLPIVISDIPIFRSIVDESLVAFFELDNISSLVNAIKHADKIKEQLSLSILSYYKGNLTIDAMTNNYTSLYFNGYKS